MKRRQQGLSLVELMVALAIGSVLIAGTVLVYVQSRKSYSTNDTYARLQEGARYAFSVLEPDLRMAGFWGLVNNPESVTGRARPTEGAAPVAIGSAQACGNNFAVDLYSTTEGTDASYGLPCAAFGGVQPNTDTVTTRRASIDVDVARANRIQIWSTRNRAELFSNGVSPGTVVPSQEIHNLFVNAYYVSRDSDNRPGLPSLRRKSLVGAPQALSVQFADQEILPGVEDLQVQFGLDPTGVNKSATRYMNAGPTLTAAIDAGGQIVAVRIWVLMRAETAEVGFTDNKPYSYANRPPFTPGDGFRRVLFSRTIQLRNSLG